jgi:hypothetical protein
MSKQLKRYVFLFAQLQGDDIDDDTRNEYEDEIDAIYFDLDDDDLVYIAEKELEM